MHCVLDYKIRIQELSPFKSTIKWKICFHIFSLHFVIRLGLNVALIHQNRSYRDSETKENVEAQERKQRGGNDRKRTATTENKHNYI